MKPKVFQWVLTLFFCVFLGSMVLLYLFSPKESFSPLEKRYLAEGPKLSWDAIQSGQFSADAEDYMADHIPFRDLLVGLNAYFKLFTGQQAAEEIRVTPEGILLEQSATWDPKAVQANMNAINTFAAATNIQVDLMIVPSAGWAVAGYDDEAKIRDIYALAGENVVPVDVLTALSAIKEEPLYYRTDHHWTSLGAHTAYAAYMEAKDRAHRAKEEFTVEAVPGFYGSTYSRSALWLTPADTLELWTGTPDLQVTNKESGNLHTGIFYRERLEEADKYTVFLDGNHSLVTIQNPHAAGKGKLLVIRDSYSNCLGGFLAESYETVVLVDLRYYKQPISQLLAQEGFDDILVCYSLGNFLTDKNIIWLR